MSTSTSPQTSLPPTAGGVPPAPLSPGVGMDIRDDYPKEKLNPGTKRPRTDDIPDVQPPQPPKRPAPDATTAEATPGPPEPQAPLASLEERGIVVPPFEKKFRIEGLNRKEYLYLAGPTTRGVWDALKDPKVLAHIPNDWYRLDPTTTIRIVSRVAKLITGNSTLSVLPATPKFPKLAEAGAKYIPTLIVDISAEDEEALLSAPIFSTVHGTIVTKSFTFPPDCFICQVGDTCLTGDDPQHVSALRQAVQDFIKKAGSGPNRVISSSYDNIPDTVTNTTDRATYIAATVRVEPIVLGIRHDDGSQDTRTRFNIFALPPTNHYAKHQGWVDAFTRVELYDTMYGPVRPVESYQCTHCSAQSHPSGLCPYMLDLAAHGFQDTAFPDRKAPVPIAALKKGGSPKSWDGGKRYGKSGGHGGISKGKNAQRFK